MYIYKNIYIKLCVEYNIGIQDCYDLDSRPDVV